MLPRNSGVPSAQKRKHTEYEDPDYPNVQPNGNEGDQLGQQGTDDLPQDGNETQPQLDDEMEGRLKRLRKIISREFQIDINQKLAQIEEINERRVQARHLLDRLRYAIVAEYYQKQEIPLTAAEASAIRGKATVCDDEVLGPQMPLHPSIKKIIGAKTADFNEILKPVPVRAAAQNAKSTIRLKAAEQRRKERQELQNRRLEGFVIDHSQGQGGDNLGASHVNTPGVPRVPLRYVPPRHGPLLHVPPRRPTLVPTTRPDVTPNTRANDTPTVGKALNAARMNNKLKHLLVVGNTSKYIGGEGDSDLNSALHGRITHKWLVYIKTKNTAEPLEKFVSKVRFFLHASYRPNNIVDICEPPYQFSRRGWGEFPLKIQLFFHEHLKQKPIQLVHNIVLDKSLCGLQTMGAETMLEIWLPNVDPPRVEPKVERTFSGPEMAPQMAKPRTISITHNKEELDDNLFRFLADIDQTPTSVCADIGNLQPTVMVTEPYTTAPATMPAAAQSSQATATIPAAPQSSQATATIPAAPRSSQAPATISTAPQSSQATARVPAAPQSSQATATIPAAPRSSQAPATIPAASHSAQAPATIPVSPRSSQAPATIPAASHSSQAPATLPVSPRSSQTPATNPATPRSSQAPATIPTVPQFYQATPAMPAPPRSYQAGGGSFSGNGPRYGNSRPNVAADNYRPLTKARLFARDLIDEMRISGPLQRAVTAPSASEETKPKFFIFDQSTNAPYRPPASAPRTLIIDRVANGNAVPPAAAAMTSAPSTSTGNSRPVAASSIVDKLGARKRVVQLKDRDGNVKLVQMLMAKPKVVPLPKDGTSSQNPESQANTPVKTPEATTSKATSVTIKGQKKIVFQKEGKVYIIDPAQMKLKQQQRKQESLLKPQVSLLKQQQQQQSQRAQQNMTTAYRNVVEDHNYTPRQPIKQQKTPPTATVTSEAGLQPIGKPRLATTPPPLHYGIRQTRVNASQLAALRQRLRQKMEQQFLRAAFHSIRSAVDYLLRRIPLIATKGSVAAAYPFVWKSIKEFESLPVMKRRACEWLRAKHIGRLLGQHKQLPRDAMWSTREILQYSRVNAYIPYNPTALVKSEAANVGGLSDLVKNELRQEEKSWHYDTLTKAVSIKRWINSTWQHLQKHDESSTLITDIIDVDGDDRPDETGNNKPSGGESEVSTQRNDIISIGPPERLNNEITVVSGICKDLDVRLQPEEIAEGVTCPLAQTVMAQALRILLEKLLRQSVASKLTQPAADVSTTKGIMQLNPHDISRVIADNKDGEYDFLTKHNFGVPPNEELLKTEESQSPQIDTKSPVQLEHIPSVPKD